MTNVNESCVYQLYTKMNIYSTFYILSHNHLPVFCCTDNPNSMDLLKDGRGKEKTCI